MSVKYVVDAFRVKAALREEHVSKSIVNPNWNLSKMWS